MRRKAVLAVCILLCLASPVWADFYRYVDNNGNEFFTNDLKQVPTEYRDRVTVVKPDESRVNVSDTPPPRHEAPVNIRAHQDKHGKGEEYWRRRAENLRLKLRDQEDDYQAVLEQIRKLDEHPRKKKKSASSLEKKKRKLERDMAKTRRILDVDLPEAARKAGAYPGWLRE